MSTVAVKITSSWCTHVTPTTDTKESGCLFVRDVNEKIWQHLGTTATGKVVATDLAKFSRRIARRGEINSLWWKQVAVV